VPTIEETASIGGGWIMSTDQGPEVLDLRAAVTSPQSPIASLITGPAIVIDAEAGLAEAAEVMRAEAVSALLLSDHEGIITERDIVRAVAAGCDPNEPVVVSASRHPVTVDGSMPVVRAAGLMLNEHVRHLVVDDAGEIGIVSLRDLVAVLLQVADPELWLTSLRVTVASPEVWLG
jgi:signal-transduction protein with cAMP-binding, CBS, and nucleotidyltransferase domain